MGAVLEHALRQSRAARGLIFDRDGVVRSVGYSAGDRVSVWHALNRLLVESHGLERSSKALFGVLDAPAWGLAGVLTGAAGTLAVLAVEKETSLESAEIEAFADWIALTGKPLDVSICYSRWKRAIHRQPVRFRDLPIADLVQVPNLAEVERLLVSLAMDRSQNNRGKAAAALGISREGLRRKLMREEI
jgi:DNA-binding protein Fis